MKKSTLEKLKEKKSQLEAKIQMIKNREKSTERKLSTRKKILVGAYYLDKAKKDEKMGELVTAMDKFLNKEVDILKDQNFGFVRLRKVLLTLLKKC